MARPQPQGKLTYEQVTAEDGTALIIVQDGVPMEHGQQAGAPPKAMRRNIMCVGKNYLEHVGEVDSTMPGISKAKVPDWPIIFTKAPSAVAGPGEAVGFPEGLSE